MVHALIGALAGLVAVTQGAPYIVSVLRGHSRPHRASFGIWAGVGMVLSASYITAGARTTIWAGLALLAQDIIVFLLAIKRGEGGLGHFDLACVAVAVVAVAAWAFTDDPAVAVYLSTAAIVVAFLPTLRKVCADPASESRFAWRLYAVSCVLNVGALTSFKPSLAVLPLAMVPPALVMVVLLGRRPTGAEIVALAPGAPPALEHAA
jgi:hypothetical protein